MQAMAHAFPGLHVDIVTGKGLPPFVKEHENN